VSLRLKYAFQTGASTAVIDPVADGIAIRIAGAGPDQVSVIAPGDPAWVVTGSVATWQSPTPGVLRVVVNTAKRTIRLDATGLTFDASQAHNTVRAA